MKNIEQRLQSALSDMPVIAILRGVKPHEAQEIGRAVFEAGIRVIEVPLNSPDPFDSISNLKTAIGESGVIGCGTLTRKRDVVRVAQAGAEIAVTPNTNPTIIKRCLKLDMLPIPGWSTPTEAFAAYRAGARYLKLFPASSFGLGHVAAIRAVLPKDARVLAVGGVGADDAGEWLAGGIDGFGIGSDIYKPGRSADQVLERATAVVKAIREAKACR